MLLTGTRKLPSHGGQVPKSLSQNRYSEGAGRSSLGTGGKSAEGSMRIYLCAWSQLKKQAATVNKLSISVYT